MDGAVCCELSRDAFMSCSHTAVGPESDHSTGNDLTHTLSHKHTLSAPARPSTHPPTPPTPSLPQNPPHTHPFPPTPSHIQSHSHTLSHTHTVSHTFFH